MTTDSDRNHSQASVTPFLGLAPFLRMNLAGADLVPVGKELLARAEHGQDDANLWMNLATVMQCLGERDFGLVIQSQALELSRVYHLRAASRPARAKLLMVTTPGDLSKNMPLDCLLENSDIDLDFYYVSPEAMFIAPVPEHDALIVGVIESDDTRGLLAALEERLADWPKPVINAPDRIPRVERGLASRLLQDAPGLLIPPSLRTSRAELQRVASGAARLPELFEPCEFPVILRPVGSYGGHGLERIERADEIAAYLARVDATEFFLARFIDYSGPDGMFRKFRIALIDGAPYICHMAVSSDWMIHYVNANMYEDAGKRAEEAAFMDNFDDFVRCHQAALHAIHERIGLDYLCIDCAETVDGQLLVFEIDHVMIVHAMDPVDLFPYKPAHMQKVKDAFRNCLFRRIPAAASNLAAVD
jgi:glutathione synthase/RimK-type ligase-like ATP-grasp enzyme